MSTQLIHALTNFTETVVVDPTLELLEQLTPHMDRDCIRAGYEKVAEGVPTEYPSFYFVVPGLHVQGGFHSFSLTNNSNGFWLRRDTNGGGNVNLPEYPKQGADAVIAWQKENLDYDKLINPFDEAGNARWGWFQANYLVDPSRRVPTYYELEAGASPEPVSVEHGMQKGRPVSICAVAFVFEKGKTPNETQTHQDFAAQEADCNLMIHSSQHLLWNEVKGANKSRGGCPTTWCALCGNSMHMTGCTRCDYRYRDNQFDCGGGPPINATAQALAEKLSDWTFPKDPEIARATAREVTREFDREHALAVQKRQAQAQALEP